MSDGFDPRHGPRQIEEVQARCGSCDRCRELAKFADGGL